MPAYPTRTATKQSTITKNFVGANDIVAVYDYYIESQAYGDGYTSDVPIFVQGSNTFGGEYVLKAGSQADFLNIIHGTDTNFSYNPEGAINIFNEKLIVDISTASNNRQWYVTNQSLVPSGSVTPYDPGAASATYSLDVSSFSGMTNVLNMFPFVGNGTDFKVGSIYHSGASADNDFYLALMSSGGDQGIYNAFTTPGLSFSTTPDLIASYGGTSYNYTYMCIYDGVGNHFLTEWTNNTYQGSFTSSNFNIELSDPTDDAIFQQLVYSYGGNSGFCASSNGLVFSFIDTFPLTSGVAFVFNEDMTEYDRIDIIADGDLGEAVLFIDGVGDYWLTGYEDSTGDMLSYYLQASEPEPPADIGTIGQILLFPSL